MATSPGQVLRRTPNDQTQQESSDGLTFWEKELIENQRRRQLTAQAETSTKNDSDDRDTRVNDDNHLQEQQALSPQPISTPTIEHIASTDVSTEPGQITYHPGGIRTGGIPATKLDTDIDSEDYDLDSEPVSSYQELVGRFCIFSQVIKFPYKYMQDSENRVSKRFFSSEKAYQRNWSMHYLFGPDSYSHKPLMLVPLSQVQQLIEEIGQAFQIDVDVPEYPFQIPFYKDGTPTPTPIGTVNSKADMTDVQSKIPTVSEHYGSLPINSTDSQVQDHDAWVEKMERAFQAEKKKKASTKKRRERQRWLVKEDAGLLQRAQRYLGLREKLDTSEAFHRDTTPDDHQLSVAHVGGSSVEVLDFAQLAPFPFEDDVVMISVDVESWENDHSVITEIGVSTLDTADIKAIAPGIQGENWIKKIRSRHLRIKGRESLYNFKFCSSNPDMFEFGYSEFVMLEEAPRVVDSCFEHPYSASFDHGGPPQGDEKSVQLAQASTNHGTDHASNPDSPRALLLVGHDISADMEYLSSLGSSIFSTKSTSNPDEGLSRRQRVLSSIRELQDTAVLYKILNKDEQTRSLTKVCAGLDVIASYPHNAGNDARYTLEAFVKMVIRSRQQDDGVFTITQDINDLKIEKEAPTEAMVQASMEDTIDDPSVKDTTDVISGQVSDYYTPFCGPEGEYVDIASDRRHIDPEDETTDDDSSSDEPPY